MRTLIPELSFTKKDFNVDTFKSGGKGGQHQNTCDSGVRITHIETGISSECRETRSQHQNKKIAFKNLAKILIAYLMDNQEKERYASGTEVVRTYNQPDNRIKDHHSKKTYLFDLKDVSKMIDERRLNKSI